MPSARATWRASSTASVPQQLPNRFVGASASCRGQTRMVIPTTSYPCSTSKAAATDESTPPLIPTMTRSANLDSSSEQTAQALELLGSRVCDLDPTAPIIPDDAHAGHQRPLQHVLEGGQLHRAAP